MAFKEVRLLAGSLRHGGIVSVFTTTLEETTTSLGEVSQINKSDTALRCGKRDNDALVH